MVATVETDELLERLDSRASGLRYAHDMALASDAAVAIRALQTERDRDRRRLALRSTANAKLKKENDQLHQLVAEYRETMHKLKPAGSA